MKKKKTKILLISLISFTLFLFQPILSQRENQILASEEPEILMEPSLPGRTEGIGKYFEIKDSEYLNIILKSTEEIKIILESIPKMISLNIEAISEEINSTILTIEGLESNKTYYKYEDSYKQEVVFISDENGSYIWTQDLTQPHHIWFQEVGGTIFFPEQCSNYGTWDATTSTCTLNRDLNESVEISSSNITLDCNNHQITGGGSGYGIFLTGFWSWPFGINNVTVQNCNVSNFAYGIYSGYSFYSTLKNNITQNNSVGIQLHGASNNFIEKNITEQNGVGITFAFSSSNNITSNKIQLNEWGIVFGPHSGPNNILRNNAFSENQYNIFFPLGMTDPPPDLNQDIDPSNTINGKPIYYLVNEKDKEISGEAGFVGLVNSSNIRVKNLTLSNNFHGIFLVSTQNSTIENVQLSQNYYGIYLDLSSNNIFLNNQIFNNQSPLLVGRSSFNTFVENTVKSNNGPLLILSSSNNLFYHNNFINNQPSACGHQVHLEPWTERSNIFYNGYPSGGNYWSDYTGIDEKSGENQDQSGSDGIGDTPFNIYAYYYYWGLFCPLVGQDRYPFMRENGWEALPEPQKWSFAIITDLHIGRGYTDYDGENFEDNGEGENYYLTERLKRAVNWLNENKNNIDCGETKCSIKFLVILGDIADTAEKSEFLKAKNILDKLNDPNGDGNLEDGIPYIPVFGNHDVWPYTNSEEATTALGENYFDEIFWDGNTTNTKLIQEKFNNSFKRDEIHRNYKNFAFSYREMNFIGLDFASRESLPRPLEGVGSDAVLGSENEGWLEFRLNEFNEKPVIIFSHHPFVGNLAYGFSSSEIDRIKIIIENNKVLANFGGHIHGFDKFLGIKDIFMNANFEYSTIDDTKVITTESLMVGSNEEEPKGIIRIVKVLDDNQIDNNNWETTEEAVKTEFIAMNPYFSFTFTQPTKIFPCVFFKAHIFTKREVSYYWDLGDGTSGSGEWETRCYSGAGTYDVTLTVTDVKTGEKEYITQKVEVKEGIIPRFLKIADEVKDKIELISTTLEEDLTQFGRVIRDTVFIKVKHSEPAPVGLINVHFEQATGDIDLSTMVADIDLNSQKSVLYMPQWPNEIEESKILFISFPKK